jgi:hypothetical protein
MHAGGCYPAISVLAMTLEISPGPNEEPSHACTGNFSQTGRRENCSIERSWRRTASVESAMRSSPITPILWRMPIWAFRARRRHPRRMGGAWRDDHPEHARLFTGGAMERKAQLGPEALAGPCEFKWHRKPVGGSVRRGQNGGPQGPLYHRLMAAEISPGWQIGAQAPSPYPSYCSKEKSQKRLVRPAGRGHSGSGFCQRKHRHNPAKMAPSSLPPPTQKTCINRYLSIILGASSRMHEPNLAICEDRLPCVRVQYQKHNSH